MSLTLNPFRSTTRSSAVNSQYGASKLRQQVQNSNSNSAAVQGGDSVTLSAAATEPKRNGKKMAILGAIGTAVGIAAAVLIPGVGLGGVLLAGVLGGVGGAAIGDGALKDAGTREPKPFDPYKPGDLLDPDNLFHPRNPYNPLNFPK